jgi:hypothetical protein
MELTVLVQVSAANKMGPNISLTSELPALV